jgi:ADP-heptose:LPS heptosyltransferase
MLPWDACVLAIHADTSPEKMWRSERFIAALDIFLERHHEFFVFLVGGTSQALDRGSHGDRVILAYHLPFDAICALVASADLFLGVDSCMLHLADLEMIPSVGLFGPTRAAEFGFIVGPNVTLQCMGGMDMISHRRVALALESLLANPIQSALWMIEDPFNC